MDAAAAATVGAGIVVETNVRDQRIVRQSSNDRPEMNIAPLRSRLLREVTPVIGHLIRDAGTVPVTIVVHEETGRVASVVRSAMIADATNLVRPPQSDSQPANQPHPPPAASRISGAESSTNNPKSLRLPRECPTWCPPIGLVRNPLRKVHKRRMPF